MAIGVDDKVVFDGRHVSDKVVGGGYGMLRLEAVVTELADVSWQGRSKICRQWRLLGNLEAKRGYMMKTTTCLTLSTCGGKSCLWEDGTQSPS